MIPSEPLGRGCGARTGGRGISSLTSTSRHGCRRGICCGRSGPPSMRAERAVQLISWVLADVLPSAIRPWSQDTPDAANLNPYPAGALGPLGAFFSTSKCWLARPGAPRECPFAKPRARHPARSAKPNCAATLRPTPLWPPRTTGKRCGFACDAATNVVDCVVEIDTTRERFVL
jgi:hypothetical protein